MFNLGSICYLWAISVFFGFFKWLVKAGGFSVEMRKGFGILQRLWRREQLFYSVYSTGNTDLIGMFWKGTHYSTVVGLPSGGSPKYWVHLESKMQFSVCYTWKWSPFSNEWFLPCSVFTEGTASAAFSDQLYLGSTGQSLLHRNMFYFFQSLWLNFYLSHQI